jgi:uncharacterized protein YndB with AHSA1/START domain
MTTNPISRRALGAGLTATTAGLGMAKMALAAPDVPAAADPSQGDGVTHDSDAIHQEVVFEAGRGRVWRALTDSAQFDQVTRLSDAAALVMAPGAIPTRLSGEPGGAFALFGGYITGRQIELAPEERLVQAWRSASWRPGDFSLARFVLADEGAATRLVFDHTGFPAGTAVHLAHGWHSHYWDPLAKFLARDSR